MYKIGYRTIKTAIGTALAIMLAQWAGLDNYASAGIIAILCIQNTKKKSLEASWSRFFACIVAMGFSAVFFEGLGYYPIVIGLLLLFFIPTMVSFKATEGIVTSSVIILHIFSAEAVSFALILNELGIITIGIGIALIMNLYMPSVERDLFRLQEDIETNFYKIFQEVILFLREGDHLWDGKEITETSRLIKEGKSLAYKDVENHFLRDESLFYHYFSMREKQFEIIERLLTVVTSISHQVEQAHIIADFMEDLSKHIHPGNTAMLFLKKLYDMKVDIENMELPTSREEFEARAALFQFVQEMERYLQIKSSFRGLQKEELEVKQKAN
ncbi:uncharacterized membrane protein YgaE (UPF0421/DUF939 family) [Bacillus ectoiniformans]|uniref:aromatic acid exporter family protein n=1 Tax=Bacillus ectoiniformans TaxID=1494429 RepID=UPI0019596E69|nr:aromatic acid exporter family protein [Bacillus ectoiniformans]MBM7648109.1 uncharacterized membrane protein YgaE (UPF0421/DUF939 family) [Bacillus ectoiniformans]